VIDQPDRATSDPHATEAPEADPAEVHRLKQRRLLFAIELTLFGLVLVLESPGSQIGFIAAVVGFLIGLSGL
jgi:hypothetical protein